MPEAFIVDAVRTPVGRRGGGLSQIHPADLGAHSLSALMDRTGIDPGAVEDVIFGCVDTVGGQAGDIARTCWLAAGLPEHVPGTTDRPPVRLGPAGHPLRRPGRDGRRQRRGRGRRRAADVDDPDQLGHDPRRPTSASPTRSPAPRAG